MAITERHLPPGGVLDGYLEITSLTVLIEVTVYALDEVQYILASFGF